MANKSGEAVGGRKRLNGTALRREPSVVLTKEAIPNRGGVNALTVEGDTMKNGFHSCSLTTI